MGKSTIIMENHHAINGYKSTIIIGIYHYILYYIYIYLSITMVNQLFRLGHFNHSKLLNGFLVGFIPTPLKNDGLKVSWDDDIPNWMEK